MAPSNMTGTSSPAEGSEQVADKGIDRTLALYGSYRQTGWALSTIVILKGLPVLQCWRCPEYLMEDAVLRRVDEILARVDGGTELEIIRYAA